MPELLIHTTQGIKALPFEGTPLLHDLIKHLPDAPSRMCGGNGTCGACAVVCPREAITVHKGCYALVDDSQCIGCGKCEKVCPAGCIQIKERGQNEV